MLRPASGVCLSDPASRQAGSLVAKHAQRPLAQPRVIMLPQDRQQRIGCALAQILRQRPGQVMTKREFDRHKASAVARQRLQGRIQQPEFDQRPIVYSRSTCRRTGRWSPLKARSRTRRRRIRPAAPPPPIWRSEDQTTRKRPVPATRRSSRGCQRSRFRPAPRRVRSAR